MSLALAGPAVADLATYVSRARRLDPGGAIRLVASGRALAAYVSPLHGNGGPTVLGLRVLELAEPADVDTTVYLAAVTDRLARLAPGGHAGADVASLALPPVQVNDAGWAGLSPPRSGWEPVGALSQATLDAAARAGAAEIAAGAPEGSGAHAVARLRALVWAREVPGVPGLAAGAAFVAEALGFLQPDGAQADVTLLSHGVWQRLSTARGHVLARPALL
jgi:hypothetical protein